MASRVIVRLPAGTGEAERLQARKRLESITNVFTVMSRYDEDEDPDAAPEFVVTYDGMGTTMIELKNVGELLVK